MPTTPALPAPCRIDRSKVCQYLLHPTNSRGKASFFQACGFVLERWEELCDALAMSQSTLSTHLQVIRDAGLVRTRREGRWIYYAPDLDMEPLTEAIFKFFRSPLSRHPTLSRDKASLKQRSKVLATHQDCIPDLFEYANFRVGARRRSDQREEALPTDIPQFRPFGDPIVTALGKVDHAKVEIRIWIVAISFR